MAEQSVLLTSAQARAIVALVNDEGRAKAELARIGESYQELGRLYAQAHQLPQGEFRFRGEGEGKVRLVVITTDEPPAQAAEEVGSETTQ